jgi:hypothetical protein
MGILDIRFRMLDWATRSAGVGVVGRNERDHQGEDESDDEHERKRDADENWSRENHGRRRKVSGFRRKFGHRDAEVFGG